MTAENSMSAHQRIAARKEAERLARLAMEAQELARAAGPTSERAEIYRAAYHGLLNQAVGQAERAGPRPWPWMAEIIQAEIIDVRDLFGTPAQRQRPSAS